MKKKLIIKSAIIGGSLFLTISLILAILSVTCWSLSNRGGHNPDAGLLCTYSIALPFLPYILIFNMQIYMLLFAAVIINTLIGLFFGLIVGYFSQKLGMNTAHIIFILLIILETSFFIIFKLFYKNINYFLFLSTIILTIIVYVIYFAYRKISRVLTIFLMIPLILILFSSDVYAGDWYPGTTHVHTGFSTQTGYPGQANSGCSWELEGGDPLHPIVGYSIDELAAQSENLGLYWNAYTDHSYCMNSAEFNIVKNDCSSVDSSEGNSFACLAGEEVSADELVDELEWICTLYANDEEAHVGALGINNYISQTPADRHCPTTPNVQSTIDTINSNGGISIVNHPYLTEGGIKFLDFASLDVVNDEKGIEIWNGEWSSGARNNLATAAWRGKLLEGEKVYAYGGTDSHEGITETPNLNWAFIDGSINSNNLKTALKNGYSFISNNGILYIEIQNPYNDTLYHLGETFNVCRDNKVKIKATYDIFFGSCNLEIRKGDIWSGLESVWNSPSNPISGSGSYELSNIPITRDAYFRAECINSDGTRRIYTNLIWIDIDIVDADGDNYCSAVDCNDNDPARHPDTAETACSDGKDNDCDGLADGSDPDCGGSGCTCSGWSDVACGAAPCSSSKMKQSRNCNPSGCSDETRCVANPSCGSADKCADDETSKYCWIETEANAQLYSQSGIATELVSPNSAFVCGSNYCSEEDYAGRLDVNNGAHTNCPDNLEGNEDWVRRAILTWPNGGPADCKNTDLYLYNCAGCSDNDLTDPSQFQSSLTNKNNWQKVTDFPDSCTSSTYPQLEITSEFKNDLSVSENDEIVYGFWPETNQNKWAVRYAGSSTVNMDVDYCKPCIDNDGDGYGSDCPKGTDCNDANPNINPGRIEVCTDGIDNNCNSLTDCQDSSICGYGVKCGLCKVCWDGTCSANPGDDPDCGVIDCSLRYIQTGTESPIETEVCYSRQDLTYVRCKSAGVCKTPNSADCDLQPADQPQYSCGTCTYINASNCNGNTLGTCSFYGTASQCDSGYKCSNSAGGDNAYDTTNYKSPSQGYCDGSGSCDYSSSVVICNISESGEGSSVCIDGSSTCQNFCNDGIDNDGDGDIDNQDSDCATQNSPPTTPTNLFCNGAPCTNNQTFFDNIVVNCSGSTDPEGDGINYSIDAYYMSALPSLFNDNFEDGTINNTLWQNYTICSIYGCDVREVNEILGSDGYISLNTSVKISGNTRGSLAILKTKNNFNDSKNHLFNFTWECEQVGEMHVNYCFIEISNSTNESSLDWSEDRSGITLLRHQSDIGKNVWSLRINTTTQNATLYNPDGSINKTRSLSNLKGGWYIQFKTAVATSMGFPALDQRLYLYDFVYNSSGRVSWSNIGNHSKYSVLNWNITSLIEQSGVSLRCRAIDPNGSNKFSNYFAPNINITIANRIPPIVSINEPQNITYNILPILFNVTLNEDGKACNYTLDNGKSNKTMQNNGNRNFNASNSSIADGSYTARYYCWDMSNNLNGTATRTFSVDRTKPLVTILEPQNITYTSGIISFNFTLNEAGACRYSLNGGVTNYTMTANASSTGFNATNSSIADGSYIARAYCNDTAGNKNDTVSIVFSKTTLATPPINLSQCKEINASGSYILIGNVASSGTCFNITANNVSIDCKGYLINYSTAGVTGYGVYLNGYNLTTIKNCKITEGNANTDYKSGIYLLQSKNNLITNNTIITIGMYSNTITIYSDPAMGTYTTISNNNLNSTNYLAGGGIVVYGSSNNTINSNVINSNVFSSATGISFMLSAISSNTITNNIIKTGNDGIAVSNQSGTIISNNSITTYDEDGWGLFIRLSNSTLVTNNSITTYGEYSFGFELWDSDNNLFANNYISTSGIGADGFGLIRSNHTNVANNSITTFGQFARGFYIYSSINNTYMNNIVTTNGSDAEGVYIYDGSGNSFFDSSVNSSRTNDTYFYLTSYTVNDFTNVTFINNRIGFSSPSVNSRVNFNWYLDAYVKNATNSQINQANVTAWNVSYTANMPSFSVLTGADGRITRQILLDYWRNATTIINQNNYTINVSKTGYITQTRSVNMSTNRYEIFILTS